MLQVFLPWTPMTGTTELPNTPNAAMLSGQVHDVPIVIGTVRDESLVVRHILEITSRYNAKTNIKEHMTP